jgi:hypothetical protein
VSGGLAPWLTADELSRPRIAIELNSILDRLEALEAAVSAGPGDSETGEVDD